MSRQLQYDFSLNLSIKNFSFGINFDLQSLFETSSKSELEEEPGAD